MPRFSRRRSKEIAVEKRIMATSRGKRMLQESLLKQESLKRKKRERPDEVAKFWVAAHLDQDGFELTHMSEYKGFGVVATKEFSCGDFLLEYVGERLSYKEGLKRETKYCKSGKDRHFLYLVYKKPKIESYWIDATNTTGRLGHMINDGDRSETNCVMKKIHINNTEVLCLFATKPIQSGEELLYDYGDGIGNLWWRAENKRTKRGASSKNEAVIETPNVTVDVIVDSHRTNDTRMITADTDLHKSREYKTTISPVISSIPRKPQTVDKLINSHSDEHVGRTNGGNVGKIAAALLSPFKVTDESSSEHCDDSGSEYEPSFCGDISDNATSHVFGSAKEECRQTENSIIKNKEHSDLQPTVNNESRQETYMNDQTSNATCYGQRATRAMPYSCDNEHNDSRGQIVSDSSCAITIQMTDNNNNKRSWNKKFYCLFCDKPQSKLPRHLVSLHKEEPRVIEYVLEKDSRSKQLKLTKLRNLGNHHHNVAVLREGKGELIVGYRPNRVANPEDYAPCQDCFIYLVRTDLWKHKCPGAKGSVPKGRPALSSKLLLPAPQGVTTQLHEFLLAMIDDNIARAVRNDELILDIGQREFQCKGHDKDQHNDIRQTLRRLGRLLVQLRAQTHSISRPLSSFIDPEIFMESIEAVKAIAGYDEASNTYKKPSLALKCGQSLNRCSKIVEGKAIIQGNKTMLTNATEFARLCELNWKDYISANASRTVNDNKRNKVKMLPLTEDIMHFSQYLKAESVRCQKEKDEDSWKILNEVTLARVILFNRRRQGEASRMTLSDYNKKARPDGDRVTQEGLSPIEKELCKTLHRIEIRGKRGNTVPVLLTKDVVEAIDRLIETRKGAGVAHDNAFLFPRSNYNSLGHIRGSDVLREHSMKCGAAHPELLRSTGLRKQIATVSQIVNLKDNELDILAKFLGHDIRVHREYYRLPDHTIQVAKVSKLLLASEQGRSDLAGKSLDQVEVDMDDELEEEVTDGDDEELELVEEDAPGDASTAMGNIIVPQMESAGPKRKHKKRPWSTAEKVAALKHLGKFILSKKVPGKLLIDECIRKEPALQSRGWKNLKDFCRNRMSLKNPLHL